jgi:fatty-acyl-CoA synthase
MISGFVQVSESRAGSVTGELSPFATPGAALAAQTAGRPAAPALAFPHSGGRLSFARWHKQATALARALLARGYRPGDHIALLAENRLEWPVVQLGVALMGGVLVPLNTHYRREDLAYALGQSDSRAMFLSKGFRNNPFLETVEALRPDLPLLRDLFVFGDAAGFAALIEDGLARSDKLPEVSPDQPAALIYTSGTTGFPKGALLSHRAMLGNAWGTAARLGVTAEDRWTSMIPLFHCAGCIMNLLGCLQHGACYVGLPAFTPEALFQTIEAERCSLLSGVPTSYLAMLESPARGNYDLSCLRAGTCGGAEANPEILERCAKDFPIPGLAQVYGQTEASTLISCPDSDDPQRLVTAGTPLPGVEIEVTDPRDGRPLSRERVGEIVVRGPMTMLGYYKQPQETAATLTSDGWLKTGDLGYRTDDGHLVIAGGRLRDMIIRGGENVYPVEVENTLLGHPAVAQVAVFGLSDAYYGEIVAAALGLKSPVTAEELAGFCAARVAGFKVPARFFRVAEFPMTPSGKIRKPPLQEAARQGRLEALP